MGCVVGAVVLFVFLVRQQSPTTVSTPAFAPTPVTEAQLAGQREQLRAARARAELLEAQNALLRSELAELRTGAASVASAAVVPANAPQSSSGATLGAGEKSDQFGEGMSRMMSAAMQQQIDARMSALKSRLHLTDGQERSLRQFFEARYGAVGDAAAKMFQGRMSPEEYERLRNAPTDLGAVMKRILTPEQWAEYERSLAEERQRQAQTAVDVDLPQLQQMLRLDQTQQEKVFDALHDVTLNHPIPSTDDPRAAGDFDQIFAARENALRAILTPEQFQSYRKYADSQRQMVSTLMQSFTNAAAAGNTQPSP